MYIIDMNENTTKNATSEMDVARSYRVNIGNSLDFLAKFS